MKNVKEIKAGGFYVFEGRSSANSSMFESLGEAREFLSSANKRLNNYLTIHEYLLTQDSWTMLCEIGSEEKIKQTYMEAREQSGRAKSPPLDEVWRIVSEQMRHMLSRFVKLCNYQQNRTGSKVHGSYKRYWFETMEEALSFIMGIHNQSYRNSQKNGKYQASRSHYRVGKREQRGHVYLYSKNLRGGGRSMGMGAGSLSSVMLQNDVLRKMIKSTISLHVIENSPNFYPKIE